MNVDERLVPLLMPDAKFEVIGNLLRACPDADSVSWDLHPRTLVVRFKKPEEDKSRSISWAHALGDVVIQSANIMANLYGEVLWHRQNPDEKLARLQARIAELEAENAALRANGEALEGMVLEEMSGGLEA